jgi:hypothetical protein
MPIRERLQFDLSADLVNPFNIVRWTDPSTLIIPNVPANYNPFGQVTSTQGSARAIQINGKIRF